MNALEIKQQLENLLLRVNEIENEKGEYIFTEKQMIEFVKDLHDEFKKGMKANLEQMTFDEDLVDLELDYNRQISVSFDSDRIVEQVMNEIDFELEDDVVADTIQDSYARAKRISN